jgi:phage terminase large subunit
MAAVRGYMYGHQGISGIILCARQYMNSLEDSSLEEVKRAIEEEPFLAEYYEVGEKYIRSHDGRISFSFAGLDKSIESIKSKGRILLCWVDEAEPVSDDAWAILIPTLREEGSGWNAELWVTWNPKSERAAVESRFRNSKDPLIKVVELNWRDNPRFPAKLERERQRDLAERPDQYEHIWEGAYVTVMVGAYYAKHILAAKQSGRIGRVAPDPLLKIHQFFDIGGTGKKADAVAIWAAQFVGKEIRLIDYYEAVSQPLATHVEWMRGRGYTPKRSQIWLPHDGDTNDKVHNVSYASALRGDGVGYTVEVIPNQGAGAAKMRIEAGRRHFPSMWFNSPPDAPPDTPTVAGGLKALGWYHEKRDTERGIGLGPEHDWASHGADAFGLLAVCAERIRGESDDGWGKKLKYDSRGVV